MGNFIKKHRQLIAYFFWGGGTTVVNFGTYFLFTRVIVLDYVAANVIAWAASVLFAFLVNKTLVFHSGSWKWNVLLPEFGKFVGARVFSGGFETMLLWLCVVAGQLQDGVVKIPVSIFVVILNYLFSKLFIFRSRR